MSGLIQRLIPTLNAESTERKEQKEHHKDEQILTFGSFQS
jgi:hypothetical protein